MTTIRRRLLTIREILRHVDARREATGKWPTKSSGNFGGEIGETWNGIDAALRYGLRGLPGGSSLARLLGEERGVRNCQNLPPLTEQQILGWADDRQQRTGEWPTRKSGKIPGSGGETWSGINAALRVGVRGLPGGSSLPKLLAEHRGVRNRNALPPLTERGILTWADARHARTGSYPNKHSGDIPEAPGETWLAVEMALSHGQRGLSGGSSLALLLAEKRSVRNVWTRPNLNETEILSWADAVHERTGKWPNSNSGPVAEALGETWLAVDKALKNGSRGLPGGSSLAKLLAERRGVRNRVSMCKLSRNHILRWADAHNRREGAYPNADSGPIPEEPGETWRSVDQALLHGSRGLRGKSSLAKLLAERRGRRNHLQLSRLTKRSILGWADAHFDREGKWPNINSGPVAEAPGETWKRIDEALRQGNRGQPGGSSLHRLLVKERGIRNPLALPPLTEQMILRWTLKHYERTGKLPKYNCGPVADAPGETWAAIDSALRYGKRGLTGKSSLAKLLTENRSSMPKQNEKSN